ncbi:flagellin [Methanosalsum zhilinae DSM 4017]|uniref:Flagellin n=1 Tax=Methanosalsum zhilinae (strain DSM 4017 / NBRC 107636 / OCM 62 / WeN5) TaxID=679901 RepID=F7XND2_METZD|nr:archaellin/type IV pilin N-terminal domain-containing protein [Methanosalsum zhilinae]AEH61182.1 flagellin [Methanosalsum zhilinae DSM 4017]
MKANRCTHLNEDKSAQVGIGTLIIFIAMVLVAAVAAAVLIQTSGVLQQRAQQTGAEATREVSSNLDVKNIEGIRAANGTGDNVNLSGTIDLLRLQIGLQAGSSPVDMNQVVVTISDGSHTNTLRYLNETVLKDNHKENIENIIKNHSTEFFALNDIRDHDNSFNQKNPVINTGDLINMYISTAYSDVTHNHELSIDSAEVDEGTEISDSKLKLSPRTHVEIMLIPEAGALTHANFVTPSTYGVNNIVKMYP